MLVDLGRNDLGRISAPGSVSVDELMEVEYYSHVMHIVSNVTGELAADKDAFDALEGDLPRRHRVRGAQGARDGAHRRTGA